MVILKNSKKHDTKGNTISQPSSLNNHLSLFPLVCREYYSINMHKKSVTKFDEKLVTFNAYKNSLIFMTHGMSWNFRNIEVVKNDQETKLLITKKILGPGKASKG